MHTQRRIQRIILAAMLQVLAASAAAEGLPQWLSLSEVMPAGDLCERLQKNFDRIETAHYQPDNVFLTEEQSGGWPGDTEGRTILGLILAAQAIQRTPLYLEEIVRRIPSHLNAQGYMGPIYFPRVNEQQIGGNCWMLSALSEHFRWTGDITDVRLLRGFVTGLFEKTRNLYATYPLDSPLRKTGDAAGMILGSDGDWMLSSDVGAGLAGLEGMVQAYDVLRTDGLKSVIEAIISVYKGIDVVKLKAHTHPVTLVMLGMIHYADIVGDAALVRWVEELWSTYERYGMSENFGCYNWFARYDSWTEPCAIADAYIVSMELWRHTAKSHYRDMAEKMYYNALAVSQYANGGFGLQNCPGKAADTPFLQPHIDEAWWCCTMRGAEGLARVAQYTWAVQDDTVTITSLNPSEATFGGQAGSSYSLSLQTEYPFGNRALVHIRKSETHGLYVRLPMPEWMRRGRVKVNGRAAKCIATDGFLRVAQPLHEGDVVDYTFELSDAYISPQTADNTEPTQFRIMHGPLLLGAGNTDVSVRKGTRIRHSGNHYRAGHVELRPIYHLMDSSFCVANVPACRTKILFQDR